MLLLNFLHTQSGGGGGGEPAPDYGTDGRYKILVTTDKDYANERDDEAANAIWFANQDKVNILGLVYDAVDGIKPPDVGDQIVTGKPLPE